jgi:hypothetical protein
VAPRQAGAGRHPCFIPVRRAPPPDTIAATSAPLGAAEHCAASASRAAVAVTLAQTTAMAAPPTAMAAPPAAGLVRGLGSASPAEQLKAAQGLHRLAAAPGGAQQIQRAGGVLALVRLLQGGGSQAPRT